MVATMTKLDEPSPYDSFTRLQDVQALIDAGVRESEVLEYKSISNKASLRFSDSDRKEIPKDVSAMANSSGGLIIYGVDSAKGDKTKPSGISGVDRTCLEAFDQILNASVRPLVSGISRKLISGNCGQNVLIVQIPQSMYSPHQSLADHKYYFRGGAESRPMTHDIVALHFGRRMKPVLFLDAEFHLSDLRSRIGLPKFSEGFSSSICVRLMLENTSRSLAKYPMVIMLWPDAADVRVSDRDQPQFMNLDHLYSGRQCVQFKDSTAVVHGATREWIGDIWIQLSEEWVRTNAATSPLIEWDSRADEMEPRNGAIRLPQHIFDLLTSDGTWDKAPHPT